MSTANRLVAFLSRPAVFAAAALAFVAFGAAVLPVMSARSAGYTPDGGAFDTGFFYTPAEALAKVAAYDDAGRAAYTRDRWTFDLAFPAVYGFFMLSAWAFSLRALAGDRARFRWLLVPILGIAFDLVENTAVTALMLSFPPGSMAAAVASSLGSALKWVFVGAGFAGSLSLPAAALVVFLVRRTRRT